MTEQKTTLIISGSTGKMGQSLKATLDKARNSQSFKNLELVFSASSLNSNICEASVIIDFSEASFSIKIVKQAIDKKIPIVIGTTGFDDEQLKIIKDASKQIPLVLAPNTSLGIATLKNMMLSVLDHGFISSSTKIEIIEKHHKAKKDSPSGTSKDIASFLKNELSIDSKIPIESIREEETAGEHIISFTNKYETLKISHKALDRSIYAKGALLAAIWLNSMKDIPGLYLMSDVFLPYHD